MTSIVCHQLVEHVNVGKALVQLALLVCGENTATKQQNASSLTLSVAVAKSVRLVRSGKHVRRHVIQAAMTKDVT